MSAQGQSPAGGLDRQSRPRLSVSGARCTIERSLGAGGQGEVFLVTVDGGGLTGQYALKWYWPHMATPMQRAALLNLVELGSPHPRFLWPIDLAEVPGTPGFGYLMPMRPPEYRSILDLANGVPPWSARVVAMVGRQLADSFLRVHAMGLCYRDINFGNVFYRPDTGAVLICDNDNVGINGSSDVQVLGTQYFMAPEIVRGEALPDSFTDLHSLAVLLFYITVRDHPLIGRRELAFADLDRAALTELCGTKPLFIFDPGDPSNAPDPEHHKNPLILWPLLPPFVRRTFEQAFVTGLHSRGSRVVESIWRNTMDRLGDAVFACHACSAELYAALPRSPDDTMAPVTCWHDGAEAKPRYLFFLGRDHAHRPRVMAASLGTVVLDRHLDSSIASDHDAEPRVLGRVDAHPRDPAIWGLRNESQGPWTAVRANGESLTIEPGASLRLEHGLLVRIASREMRVTAPD